MKHHTTKEIISILERSPELKRKLFCRGYFITTDPDIAISDYPFYDNWNAFHFQKYRVLVHKDQHFYWKKSDDKCVFMIGNAVDPFQMLYEEDEIINHVFECDNMDEALVKINQLTGNFFVGIICGEDFSFVTDPTEMLFSAYGIIRSKLYISSHPQLIGDICHLTVGDYVKELEDYRFFHKYGVFFPGNLTQFDNVKRVLTNHWYLYHGETITYERFYPVKELQLCSREEYPTLVNQIVEILHNTLVCAAKKWPNAAISLTGGMDSKTTLSAANGLYPLFQYYSYITMDGDRIDAEAAHKIADIVGIPHKIYELSRDDADYENIEDIRVILEHNQNDYKVNDNDVRKRAYFDKHADFDVEIKSWISEIGRANYYKKFGKKKMPQKLSPRNMTAMYKIFITERKLMKKTDDIFRAFISDAGLDHIPQGYDASDMYLWEFRYSAWGGKVITAEHSYSYEIFIPFNNRLLLDMMLKAPLDRRISDRFHDDLIQCGNSKIYDSGITVTNWNETKKRMLMEKLYFNISSFFHGI